MAHVVKFLDGRERLKGIPLLWPLSFDGRDFRKIWIQRLTLAQVGAYMDKLKKAGEDDPDAVIRMPLFVDENGEDLPDGLWESLDDDDIGVLNEAALSFLPRRFQAASKVMEEATTKDTPSPIPGVSSEVASAAA